MQALTHIQADKQHGSIMCAGTGSTRRSQRKLPSTIFAYFFWCCSLVKSVSLFCPRDASPHTKFSKPKKAKASVYKATNPSLLSSRRDQFSSFHLLLSQRQEIMKAIIPKQSKDIKIHRLLSIVSLLEKNDTSVFFPFYESYNRIEVREEFDSILEACYEINLPYVRGLDDIKHLVINEKNPKRVEKTILVGLQEIYWQDQKNKKTQLFNWVKIIKVNPALNSSANSNFDEEIAPVENSQLVVEESSDSKYHEELKSLMFCEMVGLEIIKRRLRTWLDYKKEIKHAIAKSKAISMPTKSSMRGLEQRQQQMNEK